MQRGFLYKRKILFIISAITINIIVNVGCSNKNKKAMIEEREGLIYVLGENEIFTGKVIDTIAHRIVEYDVLKGKKNGEFKIKSINGSIEMIGKIKNNLNEGQWRYFYPNGKIESTGFFQNNLSEGKWTWYFESGEIKEIGYFKDGKKNGDWLIFDKKGNIKRKLFFDNNRIVFDQEFEKELFS